MTIEEISKLRVEDIRGNLIYQRELIKVYKALFNQRLIITCNNCIDDALFRIRYFLNKQKDKNMVTKNSLFKLFDNIVLYVPSWHMHITNDNLTDERAIALLKLTSANIKRFEKYPENWVDIVKKDVTPIVTETVNNDVVINKEEVTIDSNVEDIKVEVTVDEIIKNKTKDEIIKMLAEKDIIIDKNSSVKKYDLALTLVSILNSK